jgi:serine/threonine-protein kinase RsbW
MSNERCLVVPNEAAQLAVLTAFLKEFWSAAALPAEGSLPFELALEEVFMNVVMHGAPAGTARVEVSLHLDGESLGMTIADDGPAFDPLSLPTPDVTAGLYERRIGGQGVHLVRQMMDSVGYRRDGIRNILTMAREIDR